MSEARGIGRTAGRVGLAVVGVLIAIPPLLVSPTAEDAFRLLKLAASEILALLSLLLLTAGWWGGRAVSLGALARRPATVFAALLVAAVVPGAIFGAHPLHWQRAATSLAVGLGCLVLWSVRLESRSLRRLLDLLALPAAALAALAILQAHDLFSPFTFVQGQGTRYGITSLAGSVGDLGAYLVLPAIVLQAGLLRAPGRVRRVARGAVLAVVLYALLLSQTLAALAAVGVGTLLLWALLLPARRRWLLALPLAIGLAAAVLTPGLERRVDVKLRQLRAGELDELLSGRPDAWKAALAMFADRPLTGVGLGGFRSEFAVTKLELAAGGETFSSRGRSAHFTSAHNEFLEALAEWGLWGAAALAAAALVLGRSVRALGRVAPPEDRALAVAGCAAFATLALASFPLRMALTAYPWVLFLAWVLAAHEVTPSPDRRRGARAREAAGPAPRGVVPARGLVAALAVVLAPALWFHTGTLLGRLEASRVVRTTSQVAILAMRNGPVAARPVLQANLPPLRRAAELDPVDAAVPMMIGSHYLLLGNTAAAREAYERALRLEPRANLYFNMAEVLLRDGRRDAAMAYLDDAVTLDPALRREAAALGWREPLAPRPVTRSER